MDGNDAMTTKQECRCNECADIHSEFISQFGKWPSQTHEQGQALKQRRIENEQSWQRAERLLDRSGDVGHSYSCKCYSCYGNW